MHDHQPDKAKRVFAEMTRTIGYTGVDMISFHEWVLQHSWQLDFMEQRTHSIIEKLIYWNSNVKGKDL